MNNKKKKQDKSSDSNIRIFHAIIVVIIGLMLGYFVYTTTTHSDSKYPFKFGLDLAGGSHLIYEADVSGVDPLEVRDLMSVLRDVIERRVNIFGVSEPIVQVEISSFVSENESQRLVVELPGVSNVEDAIAEIGRTPLLEFKLVNREVLSAQQATQETPGNSTNSEQTGTDTESISGEAPYSNTKLSGRYLKRAELVFGKGSGGLSNEPTVSIQFNTEGAQLFEDITRANVGEQLAIFLDGEVVSSPRINETISGGTAIISGSFTAEEARDLVQNLNFGALPLPIELLSTQTIGASLGAEILDKGIMAGIIGLSLVIVFMLLWYRIPGIVASVALMIYVAAMLVLFKLIPVTLTAAGLAGLVLSVGMAVDANVLVFERMKEEYANGKNTIESARIGFARAWPAIRDGNVTSILSAVILFWFGTSIVKGFALVFGVGVIVSMITAIVVTRTLLLALPEVRKSDETFLSKLYNSGLNN